MPPIILLNIVVYQDLVLNFLRIFRAFILEKRNVYTYMYQGILVPGAFQRSFKMFSGQLAYNFAKQ